MPLEMPCPSAELLRRSLDPDDPMPEPERQRIEAHVDHCDKGCKAVIDVLLRGNTELVGPETDSPASAPAAVPSERPARLGRYRIVGTLGSGGFGTVYRGYDDDLRRDVAVKAPHRQRTATPADAEAYLAEARTVAGLDHPHILPVFDLGRSDDGLCFVVSKFIEGGDLVQKTSAGRPSFAESAALTAAVAEALHHAHKRGLVHRDVKPANILIDVSGVPFLTDFGLALKEADFGKGGGLAGTPAYMSPEQANGEGHRVDGRSDIFGLGVVLYELLASRRPFRADSVAEILGQISGVEARPPRQIDDAIPKELERICLKALSKRAADRYTTARDMADDLRHFLAGMAPEGKSAFAEGRGGAAVVVPALAGPAPTTASDSRPLKVVPKGLRSFDAHDADFFLELLPGPRDRDGLPDSVRFWKTHIEETDADNTFTVGLIYGPSGCGKSSLVKAGLLPRLSGAVITVYVEATAEETETRLLNGLRKRCPALSDALGLKETLAALRRGQGVSAGKKVVIVLDQFEQWLHAKKEEQNTELVQALRQCDGGRVQCVVMVRDDFWMAATRFMRELEVRLVEAQNSAAVDLFPIRHAEKVLAAFGKAFGALPDGSTDAGKDQKPFLEQAVSGLSQEGKVIPVRLALFSEMMKGKAWTPAALQEVGGAEGVGVAFLEETFSAAAASPEHRYHQKAARGVLEALLPESGTDIKGHMRSHAELLAASGYGSRPKDFDDLMRILDGEIRLITPTDPEGQEGAEESTSPARPGQKYYQLTHDYLVPALRDWLTRKQKETRRGRAQVLLADRAAVWNTRPENRQLPSLLQWFQIEVLTHKKNWTAPQRKMMRKATRYHAERGLAAAVLLALLVWGGYEGRGALQAQALRAQLLDANTNEAPAIVQDMAPYRRWLDPLLHDAQAQAVKDGDRRKQLHVSLALLPVDAMQVDYLVGRLLDAEPGEVPVIRDALVSHKARLLDRLWAVAKAPETGKESQRIRAAAALASYDPDGEQWAEVLDQVASDFVAVPAVHLAAWLESLRPVGGKLLTPLGAVYRDRQRRETERSLATDILADYAARRPEVLADLLMDADEKQFAVLYPKLQVHGEQGLAVLQGEVDRKPPPDAKDADKEKLARRQANAAAALLKMNRPEAVWPLLKHSPDPRLRSYLIHRFGPLGADARAIIRRLNEEQEASIRRALLLSLGEYAPDQLSAADRGPLLPKVLQAYRDDPDPGLHGAAEWLLRQWQKDKSLKEINDQWAKDQPQRETRLEQINQELLKEQGKAQPQWYVNGQGQTMVVLPGPVEFLMGSPLTEVGREGGPEGETEQLHKKRIGHSFALAAREVTVEQFLRFRKDHEYIKQYAPTLDCPVNLIAWYDAAAYCNWLSKQEGIPEEQWCYLPNDKDEYAEGMKLAPDYLKRTGYRLPSEAEWEYACRAKAVTSRPYGETEELLGKYVWYTKNSLARGMLPGAPGALGVQGDCLKPNDFGLFDMLGNALEWCQESFTPYRPREDGKPSEDIEDTGDVKDKLSRVLRGGSFYNQPLGVRSACRYNLAPGNRDDCYGFRPARTFR